MSMSRACSSLSFTIPAYIYPRVEAARAPYYIYIIIIIILTKAIVDWTSKNSVIYLRSACVQWSLGISFTEWNI